MRAGVVIIDLPPVWKTPAIDVAGMGDRLILSVDVEVVDMCNDRFVLIRCCV